MTCELDHLLAELTSRHPVPGAGIGIVQDGQVDTAFTGVTSVDDPLDLDDRTLFQIGSVSKTYAVTAVLRLVTEGRVDLDHRVREYVPELVLADEQVAQDVTVRHLLNHTAGWDGSLTSGESEPDQPLAWFVETSLPTLEQVGPLGGRPEYNNASIALAGRLVEKVTGQRYEEAVRSLLLDPLGLSDVRFSNDDLVPERVAVGHLADPDGRYRIARPWRWPRAGNPAGGLVTTLARQLGWARFHLGDGRAPNGDRLLDEDLLKEAQTPSIELLGNPMGDAIGLGWFLRDIGGEPTVTHSGSTNGQFAELRLVPGRDFGVIAAATGGPAGSSLVRDAVEAVLDRRLDLRDPPPRFRPYDPSRDGEVRGSYANNLATIEVTAEQDVVRVEFVLNPAFAATMESAPTFAPATIAFREDGTGEYVVGEGDFDGQTGAFVRDGNGAVDELAFGGRWYRRTVA